MRSRRAIRREPLNGVQQAGAAPVRGGHPRVSVQFQAIRPVAQTGPVAGRDRVRTRQRLRRLHVSEQVHVDSHGDGARGRQERPLLGLARLHDVKADQSSHGEDRWQRDAQHQDCQSLAQSGPARSAARPCTPSERTITSSLALGSAMFGCELKPEIGHLPCARIPLRVDWVSPAAGVPCTRVRKPAATRARPHCA